MIQIHVRLPEEVISLIDNTMDGDNITEKVRNYICSSIINKGILEYEKEKCLARIRYIENSLKDNPFYNSDSLSKVEKDFIQETLDTISRKPEFTRAPSFFNAKKIAYNELAGKHLTGKEFELLVYRFKEKIITG